MLIMHAVITAYIVCNATSYSPFNPEKYNTHPSIQIQLVRNYDDDRFRANKMKNNHKLRMKRDLRIFL